MLGVLTHKTAWYRLWGGDGVLRLYLRSSDLPYPTLLHCSMTLKVYLSPLKYILQLCLAKFLISVTFLSLDGTGRDRQVDGQTY